MKNNKRHFSFNSLNSMDIDFKALSDSTLGNSNVSTNESNFEALILQNLELYEDVIKIMIISEKTNDKAVLIAKLLSQHKPQMIPTKNLEIYCKHVSIFNKHIKLELYDTCEKVLNDPLIAIYYKLSHAIILLCNNIEISSIVFVEKQLQKIISMFSEKDIMVICNEKKKVEAMNKQEVKQNKDCLSYLSGIEQHYHIKVRHFNINDISIECPSMEKFLQLIYIKKNKCLKKNTKSKESQSRLSRYNSDTFAGRNISCEKENTNTPISNPDSHNTQTNKCLIF